MTRSTYTPNYSQAFHLAAVELLTVTQVSQVRIADLLGVSAASLNIWYRRYVRGRLPTPLDSLTPTEAERIHRAKTRLLKFQPKKSCDIGKVEVEKPNHTPNNVPLVVSVPKGTHVELRYI